jgi:hypothetical protein
MGLAQWILNNMRTVIGIREFQFNADAGKEVFKLAPGSGQDSAAASAVNNTVTLATVPVGKKLIVSLLRLERDGGTVIGELTYNGATEFTLTVAGAQVIELEGSLEFPVYSFVNTTAAPLPIELVTANADTTLFGNISFGLVDALPPAPA